MGKKASLLRSTVVVKDFERQVFFYSAAVNLELMKTIKVPSKRISAHPICASNPGSTMTLGFMQSGGQTMLGLMAFDCEVVTGQGNLIFCCHSIEESKSAFVDAGGIVAQHRAGLDITALDRLPRDGKGVGILPGVERKAL